MHRDGRLARESFVGALKAPRISIDLLQTCY
jgi:hypothetical protein